MAIQISNLAAFDTKQQCSKKQSIIPYSLKKKEKGQCNNNATCGVIQCKEKW